ncbi:hypothetical protein, partial [Aliivibrio finisterrensis]|uniref:hypothetical protein n=1 Tax=Aliivibrio finisterrensis TaxID=511998 RepID=UPI00142ED7E1
LNNALFNQKPTLNDLSDLQDFINQDIDGDGLSNYFDPQSQNEYNFYASYTLHPEIVNNLPADTNAEYTYLIKTDIRLNNGTTQSLYLVVPTWTYGSSRHLEYRWPHTVSREITNYFTNEGVAFIRENTSSGYQNALSGIDWMELNYTDQWWTFVDYVRDATNNTAPSSTDYAAIGFSSLSQGQIDELNIVIPQNQATPNDFDKMNEMVTSYLLIHDYAKDSGNPITATAPQSTDYNNIGLTQDVSNVSVFNAWLNDAQLVVVTDISAMVNVINHAKNISGASVPADTDYTQAGITGVDASNVGAVNSAVQAQGADTFAGVQAIVDNENGWNDLIDYASQAAGSQA